MRRLFGTLVVLALILIAIGIWRGWFGFRSHSRPGEENRTTYSVDVNHNQIERDTAAVDRSARQAGERIKENVQAVTGQRTVNGTITQVGRMEKHLQVRTAENKELTIAIESSTSIVENEQTMQFDGLHEGEQVWITYSVQDGKNIARSITVLPTS
jgi:hypothetical protein